MSQMGVASVQELETVVRLCGNKEQNIQNILQNIDLSAQQHHFVQNVLLILYKKMEKLRGQRNALRSDVLVKNKDLKEMMQLNQLLKDKVQQLAALKQPIFQGQSDEIKGYQCSFDGSNQKIFQTPPFKEIYNSAKFSENKENFLDQFRTVSAFQCSEFGRQAQNLMKKYNLTAQEFKQVITGYTQEQRKRGQKLLVDSQKKLYLDNTRIIKLEDEKENNTKKTAFQKVKISFIK